MKTKSKKIPKFKRYQLFGERPRNDDIQNSRPGFHGRLDGFDDLDLAKYRAVSSIYDFMYKHVYIVDMEERVFSLFMYDLLNEKKPHVEEYDYNKGITIIYEVDDLTKYIKKLESKVAIFKKNKTSGDENCQSKTTPHKYPPTNQ